MIPRLYPRSGHIHGAARLSVLLSGLVLLAGCAGLPEGLWGRNQGVEATPAVATNLDPIARFAAEASPGTQSRVNLANGQAAQLRLVRSYHAASGRECREVLVGAGMAQRSQLVCRDEGGGWALARPLLRGGGTPRP